MQVIDTAGVGFMWASLYLAQNMSQLSRGTCSYEDVERTVEDGLEAHLPFLGVFCAFLNIGFDA